jgi:hypothetical protein
VNAQQVRIELLLDQAADETVNEGAVSLTTEIKLAQEGYMMRDLSRAVARRIENGDY